MLVRIPDQDAQDGRQADEQEEQGDIQNLRIHFLVAEDAAAELDLEHGGRIQRLDDLHPHRPEEDDHAVRLEAARGGARTAAHERTDDQDEARKHRPMRIVADGQSGSGRVAHHVESTVQKGPRPGIVDPFHLEGDRRQDRTNDEAEGIELQDGVIQRAERPACQSHENQAEMNGSQVHEHDRERGDELRPEMADGQVPRGEPARRAHAERMVDRIERRHPRQHIAHECQGADTQIHPGENEHRLVGPGTVVVARQGGQFHVREAETYRRRVRDDEEEEHHDSQTADEMCGRAPEQQTPRQRLHILEDGRSRGGEPGNAFKPSVDECERPAPERVWQHAEHEGQEPGQENDHVPVPEGDMLGLPHEDEREDAHGEGQGKADQERCQAAVAPVRQCNEDGKEHEQRAHQERRSHIPRYDLQVHSFVLDWVSRRSLIRRRSWRFSSESSVMPSLSSASWSSPSKAFSYFRPIVRYSSSPLSILFSGST